MDQIRYDIGRMDGPALNDKGYLKSEAFATRSGIFTYMLMDGSFRREFRPPEEVFSKESMDSLAEVVITNDHPPVPLDSRNTKQYAAGWTGKNVRKKDKFIQVDATITEYTTIYDVLERGKQELSCGYSCTIEHVSGEFEGERYDAIQRNIRYNHLSVVDRGRAGPDVKIKTDSAGNALDIGVMKSDSEDRNEKKGSAENKNTVSSDPTKKDSQAKEQKMTKINIDGVDYEISETLAPIVVSKIKEITSLKADMATMKSAQENLQGKFDGLQSDLKAKADKIAELESKTVSDEEIMKRADAMNKVHTFAKKILGAEFKADGKSLLEVKKEVVAKAKPDLKLDGKSEDYVDGIFAGICETHEDAKSDPLKEALKKNASTQTTHVDSKSAREASMNKDIEGFNGYKGQ